MHRITRIELTLATLVALAIALSGPGYRFGIWPLGTAFSILRFAGWIAVALPFVVVILLTWVTHRGQQTRQDLARAGVAIVLAWAAAAVPMWLLFNGSSVPAIHDITTDTVNPPAFVAIRSLRGQARNPIEYEGDAVAAQQKAAYPDIKPVKLLMKPRDALERALSAARDMGWTIIDVSRDEGRIEASDTTPFFGFVDDVVIRISADGGGSRVDVRSLSRIGRSDLGANARRIRKYAKKVIDG